MDVGAFALTTIRAPPFISFVGVNGSLMRIHLCSRSAPVTFVAQINGTAAAITNNIFFIKASNLSAERPALELAIHQPSVHPFEHGEVVRPVCAQLCFEL